MRKMVRCFVVTLACTAAGPGFCAQYHVKDLGSFGGASYPYAVNLAGQVVGYSDTASGARHSFLYSGGAMTDLGNCSAYGINDSGQIVGSASFGGPQHAFLYTSGAFFDLGTMGESSSIASAMG